MPTCFWCRRPCRATVSSAHARRPSAECILGPWAVTCAHKPAAASVLALPLALDWLFGLQIVHACTCAISSDRAPQLTRQCTAGGQGTEQEAAAHLDAPVRGCMDEGLAQEGPAHPHALVQVLRQPRRARSRCLGILPCKRLAASGCAAAEGVGTAFAASGGKATQSGRVPG